MADEMTHKSNNVNEKSKPKKQSKTKPNTVTTISLSTVMTEIKTLALAFRPI